MPIDFTVGRLVVETKMNEEARVIIYITHKEWDELLEISKEEFRDVRGQAAWFVRCGIRNYYAAQPHMQATGGPAAEPENSSEPRAASA